jgi:arylsulfatase A-like enzyme/Flp pilus assembly protein TadD
VRLLRELGAVFAASLLLAACRREVTREAPVRDVVLITIDTLRADATGFGGNARVKTPALDALAARGTVFTHAHAHNVVTLASHTNILTGLYPWQHGIRDNAGFVLDAKIPTLATLLDDAGFATGAFVSAFPLDSRFGLNRGFDVYDDRYRGAGSPLDFTVAERPGAETAQLAETWWRANAGRPRFLFVHLYEPHAPYTPPEPFAAQYRDNLYLGEVAAADHVVEELVRAIGNDALIVVTGDHGEALGDHGEATHGLFAYEATLAVPLVVVDPARAHRVDDRYVCHIDIAPTILQRANVARPANWKGTSLFAPGARGDSYFEALSASLNRGWAPLVGIMADGKKLIDLPISELYDLRADPREHDNRFTSDRRTAVALRKLLASEAPNGAAASTSRATIDDEEQAKLLSLGYVSGTSAKKSYTVADDPKNLVALDNELHDAMAAYQRGDLQGALARTRQLVAARPDMQIASEMLAFFLAQNEHPADAIALLQRRVAAGDATEAMRVRLGLMLSESGRAREAIAVLQPLAAAGDPDVLNAYGIALADSGDVQRAVNQFQRILATDDANARACQNMGIVALRAGQATTARHYLERALSLDARLPLALTALGVIEAQSGNSEAAIADWSKSVAIDGNQLDALFNLGLVAARTHPDVAKKALRDYLARAPQSRFAPQRARAKEVLSALDARR